MDEILGTAHTWFLESYQQGPYGDLVIRLVEGIKGSERKPVHVDNKVLGPYFPVTIEPSSRCVALRFKSVRAVFTFVESFDTGSLGLAMPQGKFVHRVDESEFRHFVGKATAAVEEYKGEFTEWLIWTEDQLFQVIASSPPEILLEATAPDLSIKRGNTWSAS
ncbi:hypothetical protein [Arenimonas terrae]|uniref:Uncharacterized protein n=1 Tax=Arenimonas terrae TaxID=2546226 RepID=A0A5C4RPQ7_9GAMM|nr:hypothetical protein [Arenimonas terrae]TNJ33130.1 hypothetical protein E1B00_12560 [Arenimonas terrae]